MIERIIEQYEALAETCYQLGKDEDHGPLRQAYLNSHAGDIKQIKVEADGRIYVYASIWTSTTGGSYEAVEFYLDPAVVEGHLAAAV